MADNEKQSASAPESTPQQNPGGGSGGGPDLDQHKEFMGTFGVAANQVELISRPPFPPVPAQPYTISIFAPGMGMDGFVDVRGSQGVRITSGPPPLPETHSSGTNGVEIETGEVQNVTIKRGLIPMVDQQIQMTPAGIVVDGGSMPVQIKSMTEIELSVLDGLASIKITPVAIIIQGPIVMIN